MVGGSTQPSLAPTLSTAPPTQQTVLKALLSTLTQLSSAGLIISLQLLRGDVDQVRRENPLLFSRGVAISRKLGFPDVIMPGETRGHMTWSR